MKQIARRTFILCFILPMPVMAEDRDMENVPASSYLLKDEALGLWSDDLLETILLLSGPYKLTSGDIGSETWASTRGLPGHDSKNIFVLIDGSPANNGWDEGFHWNEIDASDAGRVIIFNAPYPARFGGYTESVIEIMTSLEAPESLHGTLSGEALVHKHWNYLGGSDADFSYKKGGLLLKAGVGGIYTTGLKEYTRIGLSGEPIKYKDRQYYEVGTDLWISYRFPSNALFFLAMDSGYSNKNLTETQYEKGSDASVSSGLDIDLLGGKFFTRGYFRYETEPINFHGMLRSYDYCLAGLRGGWIRKIGAMHQLRADFDGHFEHNFSPYENVADIGFGAISAEYKVTPLKWLALIAGVRPGYHSKLAWYIDPRTEVDLTPLEELTIYVAWGLVTSFPTMLEFETEYEPLGNLVFQRSNAVSSGVKSDLFSGTLMIHVYGYFTRLKNNAESRSLGYGKIVSHCRESDIQLWGAGFEVDWNINRFVVGHIAYAYSETTDAESGEPLDYVPPGNRGSIGLRVGTDTLWARSIFRWTTDHRQVSWYTHLEHEIDGYALLDIAIGAKLRNMITLTIAASNLLDDNYYEFIGRPMRGRTFILTTRWDF